MGGKQPLKIEEHFNRNGLPTYFYHPAERGRVQTQVIKQCPEPTH